MPRCEIPILSGKKLERTKVIEISEVPLYSQNSKGFCPKEMGAIVGDSVIPGFKENLLSKMVQKRQDLFQEVLSTVFFDVMSSLNKRLDHLINHVEMHNVFNHTTEILDQLRKLKSFVQEQQQQQ